jgi:hypothetical protein
MQRLEFEIRLLRADRTPSRRYYKLLYTAALRLGVVAATTGDRLTIQLEGTASKNVQLHKPNRESWDGTLFLKDSLAGGKNVNFSNVTAIVERTERGGYHLITFWPKSQNPDARDSYTDPLVDIAMSGDAPEFFLEYVAKKMHMEFIVNPGMSPAVAVQELNQELLQSIQKSADEEIVRWRVTVERALIAQQEALEIADSYKEERDHFKDESERLQALLEAAVVKQKNDSLTSSETPQKAQVVTPVWVSLTGSSYKNIGISAYVISVNRSGTNISLRYLDKSGDEKEITDFGRQGFVTHVFDYLKARENKSAVFIITYKEGGDPKLAADTMMLAKYRSIWS